MVPAEDKYRSILTTRYEKASKGQCFPAGLWEPAGLRLRDVLSFCVRCGRTSRKTAFPPSHPSCSPCHWMGERGLPQPPCPACGQVAPGTVTDRPWLGSGLAPFHTGPGRGGQSLGGQDPACPRAAGALAWRAPSAASAAARPASWKHGKAAPTLWMRHLRLRGLGSSPRMPCGLSLLCVCLIREKRKRKCIYALIYTYTYVYIVHIRTHITHVYITHT